MGVDRLGSRTISRFGRRRDRVCLDAVNSRKRWALPMDLGPASDHIMLDSAPLTDVEDWRSPA
ncbi:hypothetical protein F6J85_06235 [Microbacterium lushaniae]|uniref:Uncharacterized protein n=1 Tax=Microbacterium lushaniae TaxID=2614639 RepID=A0A5J6L2J3_9MICO|nr:hypothetical protein F6J85_06235 [Microbacterium lushaniae]